jgi:hypothetical protein
MTVAHDTAVACCSTRLAGSGDGKSNTGEEKRELVIPFGITLMREACSIRQDQ